MHHRFHLFIAIALGFALFFCPPAYADQEGSVTVGSKIDTEGALLGKMIVLLLQDNGFDVVDKTELGGTPILRKAITTGQIDIYPEYTGNGAFFFKGTNPAIWKDARKAHQKVSELDRAENGLVWLDPAPANNTWAIAIRREMAEKNDIRTLGDFAAYVNKGGRVKLAACEEFVTREDALPSFMKAYDFTLEKDQLLVFSGCNTAQTEKAAAQNIDDVNAAMAFGTDGPLAALGLMVLEDTLSVQPVYEPAPVVRKEVLEKHPELGKILNPVFAELDKETLQGLNAEIAIQGMAPASVAEDYLTGKGHL